MLRNTTERYGLIAATLHWIVAAAVLALFPLGLWMVGLSYYDPWYRKAPDLHKGVGILLFALVALRLLWRTVGPRPAPLPTHSAIEQRAAAAVHGMLYLLLFAVMLSGYLISTADGRAVDVFGLVSVPALVSDLPSQADVAGDVHLALAITLISLAALHALAALKHHVVDRDGTLLRMLGRAPRARSKF